MDIKPLPSKPTDQQLVGRAASGDNQAYDMLFDRYRPSLLSMLQQKCQGGDQAEDILQETFVKAYLNLAQYDPKYTFGQWIYTIAKNLFIDYTRKRREKHISLDRPYEMNTPSDTQTPEERIISNQSGNQLNILLLQLPEHYRTMVELRFWGGYSYEEIAEKLNMPLGTVKTQIHRARVRLCDLITSNKLL